MDYNRSNAKVIVITKNKVYYEECNDVDKNSLPFIAKEGNAKILAVDNVTQELLASHTKGRK